MHRSLWESEALTDGQRHELAEVLGQIKALVGATEGARA